MEDVDTLKHMKELDRHHLKEGAWLTEPLQNPENNFVDDLLGRYLGDLQRRAEADVKNKKHVATAIRRVVKLTSMHDLIQQQYNETIGLREKIRETEERLKAEKAERLLQKRCHVLIDNKLGLSKKYAFKRQNSYKNPLASGVIDFDDQYRVDQQLRAMNSSFRLDRREKNKFMRDVTETRQHVYGLNLLENNASNDEDSWSEQDYTTGGALNNVFG